MTLDEMRRMAECEIDPIENHGKPALGRIMLKLIKVAEAAKVVTDQVHVRILILTINDQRMVYDMTAELKDALAALEAE